MASKRKDGAIKPKKSSKVAASSTAHGAAVKAGRTKLKPPKAKLDGQPSYKYQLRLYVAGQTRKSMVALNNLQRICDEHMAGEYAIEVIDLLEQPQLARGDQILAIPTLVRSLPVPI